MFNQVYEAFCKASVSSLTQLADAETTEFLRLKNYENIY